jgi:HKD family nuclease
MCEFESPDSASLPVFYPIDNKPWISKGAWGYHVCYFSSECMYTDIWITSENISEVLITTIVEWDIPL